MLFYIQCIPKRFQGVVEKLLKGPRFGYSYIVPKCSNHTSPDFDDFEIGPLGGRVTVNIHDAGHPIANGILLSLYPYHTPYGSIPAVITHEFGWSRFDPFTDSGTTTGNFQVNGSSGCLHLLWRWVVVSFYSGFPAAPISPRLNNESQRLWVLSKHVTMTTTYGLILWNWFSTMILSWIMVIHWMEWSNYKYINQHHLHAATQ